MFRTCVDCLPLGALAPHLPARPLLGALLCVKCASSARQQGPFAWGLRVSGCLRCLRNSRASTVHSLPSTSCTHTHTPIPRRHAPLSTSLPACPSANMRHLALMAAAAAVLLALAAPRPAHACSSFLVDCDDGGVVHGRTMGACNSGEVGREATCVDCMCSMSPPPAPPARPPPTPTHPPTHTHARSHRF